MPHATDVAEFTTLAGNTPALMELAFREGCAMSGTTRVETQDARWNESGAREHASSAGAAPSKYGGGYGKRGGKRGAL